MKRAAAAARKFNFDTSFDDAALAAAAAEAVSEPVLGEADLVEAREAGMEEGRRAGFEEGRRAGIAESLEGTERIIARTLDRIVEGIVALAAERQSRVDAATGDAALIAHAIAGKILAPLVEEEAGRIVEALLREALPQLLEEPRLVVRLAEPDLDVMRGRLETVARNAGFVGKLILIGDPEIASTDCRIEWADGGVERDGAATWAEIDRRVAEFAEHYGRGAAGGIRLGPTREDRILEETADG